MPLHNLQFSKSLECTGASKSRSRKKEKSDTELAAIENLKTMYKKSNNKLRDLVGQDYASWV